VWLFKLEICPQGQEIIFVVYYLSCLGSGFSLCLFTGISRLEAYFFALHSFCGAGSVFHLPTLLLVCYDGLLFVFSILWGSLTLGAVHWLRR
jgi:hypothetical protein